MTRTTIAVAHAGATLALHRLRDAPPHAPALLCLHGLGRATPHEPEPEFDRWPGSIWGLDFTGHGESTIPGGGGYTAEVLMADTNMALVHLREQVGLSRIALFGRGLGAYIALLTVGARPDLTGAAILDDGHGLAGGGPAPHSPAVIGPPPGADLTSTPDPFALVELATDIRPADYATTYARLAVERSPETQPIALVGVVRPPWLAAVEADPGVITTTLDDALARYSS